MELGTIESKPGDNLQTLYMDISQSPLHLNASINKGEHTPINPNEITESDVNPSEHLTSIVTKNERTPYGRTSTNQQSTTSFILKTTIGRRSALPVLLSRELNAVNKNEEGKQIFKSATKLSFKRKKEMEEAKTCKDKFLLKLKYLIDNNIFEIIMTIVVLFALIGPDLKILFLNPKYDYIFNSFFLLIMLIFIFELISSILVREDYICSFFFYLDVFASISMILEVDWILFFLADLIISRITNPNENIGVGKQLLVNSSKEDKIAMTIVILRVIRLIRIVKLYKNFIIVRINIEHKNRVQKMKEKMIAKEEEKRKREIRKMEEKARREERNSKKGEGRKSLGGFSAILKKNPTLAPTSILGNETRKHRDTIMNDSPLTILTRSDTRKFLTSVDDRHSDSIHKLNALLELSRIWETEEIEETLHQTKISKVVSSSITQKVIIVILLMMFLSAITDDDVYNGDKNLSYLILCQYLNNLMSINNNQLLSNYNATIYNFTQSHVNDSYPILNITYQGQIVFVNPDINYLTYRNGDFSLAISSGGAAAIYYSNKNNNSRLAWINLLRTFFLIGVLFYMAFTIEEDSKKLILDPLEAMIDVVDSVARDPINWKNLETLKRKIEISINKAKHGSEYEIKIIQLAIVKISALLAIGFGEAGGEILKENISSQAGLNPMLPGRKKIAIFGFCDIRHFPDINVALQEKTMMFVNEIADIVHSCVDKFGGAANKNIGDAFLMVWKFPHLEKEDKKHIVDLKNLDMNDRDNNYMADQAVLGFLNVIKKVKKSHIIAAYSNEPEILAKYEDKFKVQMGFGLHIGWGIEGAIGSFYKIDCSYLSPNVNISARLEGATRQYGVTILISGSLYDYLSPDIKNICHLIDIVTLKGSVEPVRLYTIYINNSLKPSKEIGKKRVFLSLKEKRKHYNKKKNELIEKYNALGRGGIGKLVLNKKGFSDLLAEKHRPLLFHEKFSTGFNNYIEGQWDVAYENFRGALFLDNTNGPTKTLMNYIKNRNKKAPDNWRGYRELTSK